MTEFKKFPEPTVKNTNDEFLFLAKNVYEVHDQWRIRLKEIIQKSTKYDTEWYTGYKHLAEQLLEALPKKEKVK